LKTNDDDQAKQSGYLAPRNELKAFASMGDSHNL